MGGGVGKGMSSSSKARADQKRGGGDSKIVGRVARYPPTTSRSPSQSPPPPRRRSLSPKRHISPPPRLTSPQQLNLDRLETPETKSPVMPPGRRESPNNPENSTFLLTSSPPLYKASTNSVSAYHSVARLPPLDNVGTVSHSPLPESLPSRELIVSESLANCETFSVPGSAADPRRKAMSPPYNSVKGPDQTVNSSNTPKFSTGVSFSPNNSMHTIPSAPLSHRTEPVCIPSSGRLQPTVIPTTSPPNYPVPTSHFARVHIHPQTHSPTAHSPTVSPPPDTSRNANSDNTPWQSSIGSALSQGLTPRLWEGHQPEAAMEPRPEDKELAAWVLRRFRTKVKISSISKAYSRFVPNEILSELGKQSIEQVNIGDFKLIRRVIMVCDIRKFTAFSEKLGPADIFRFLNGLCSRILPCIRNAGGFIDKFVGDAVTAMFPTGDSAIIAGRNILSTLAAYNTQRASKGREPVQMGVGVHAGDIMFGTVGDSERIDIACIGRPINVTVSVEMMTKFYSASFVITQAAVDMIKTPEETRDYSLRILDYVETTASGAPFCIYHVINHNLYPPGFVQRYGQGITHWRELRFMHAFSSFRQCAELVPTDEPSTMMMKRMTSLVEETPSNYTPVHFFTGAIQSSSGTETSVTTQLSLMRLAFSAMFHLQNKVLSEEPPSGTSASCIPTKFSIKKTEPKTILPQLRSSNTLPRKYETITTSSGKTPPSQKKPSSFNKLPPILGKSPYTSQCLGDALHSLVEESSTIPTSSSISQFPYCDQETTDIIAAAAGDHYSPPLVPKQPNEIGNPHEKEVVTWVLSGFTQHTAIQVVSQSYQRFLPRTFMQHLGKEDIESVDVGDSMMLFMQVMFCEIRILYNQSDASEPQIMYDVLNSITKYIFPIITTMCGGYIDKFFDDVILALFSSPIDAVRAAVEIKKKVETVNAKWKSKGRTLHIGIGMNSGPVMLGTIGDEKRMSGTVIGSTVNVSSRLLGLTKNYGVTLIGSSNLVVGLPRDLSAFNISYRQLDLVRVAGTSDPLWIIEFFSTGSPVSRIASEYHAGLNKYHNRDFVGARESFSACILTEPLDVPSQHLIDRCTDLIKNGVPADWSPVFMWQK